jgi:hypothetical protein
MLLLEDLQLPLAGSLKDVLQRDFSRLFAFDLTLTDEEYHLIIIKVIME